MWATLSASSVVRLAIDVHCDAAFGTRQSEKIDGAPLLTTSAICLAWRSLRFGVVLTPILVIEEGAVASSLRRRLGAVLVIGTPLSDAGQAPF